MAKIAITSIPYWGHVNVTLSIGALLLEHGHEVTWFLARDMKNLVLPEGGKLVLTNRQEDIALTNVLELLDSGKSKSAMDGSKFVLEEVLLPLSSLMHDGLTRALDVFKPDVLIHDEQTYIGAICSTQLNIPFITTHVAPSGIFETTESTAISDWYFAEIEKFQVSFGLPAVPHVVRSEKLGLTFCPRDFSNPYELMNGQVFVGPCLDAPRRYAESFDYERLTTNGKKNLMVSIGTLLTVEASRFYQKVINDFRDTDYNVIVTVDPSIFDEWPENFIVQSRVPYLELLPYLDVVITHAGANTTCDCIGMGIPLLAVPMAFDQFYVADQIKAHKLGTRLRYKRLIAGEMKSACDELINPDSAMRENLNEYSNTYKSAGGVRKAVELVEKFIRREAN